MWMSERRRLVEVLQVVVHARPHGRRAEDSRQRVFHGSHRPLSTRSCEAGASALRGRVFAWARRRFSKGLGARGSCRNGRQRERYFGWGRSACGAAPSIAGVRRAGGCGAGAHHRPRSAGAAALPWRRRRRGWRR
jgi:hypothetical protein